MLSLQERLEGCTVPLLQKLFRIMIDKKTNLCVAADGMSIEKTMRLIDKVGPHICILKLHCGHFGRITEEILQQLYNAKKRYNFLLFEDAKFADGPEAVRLTYEACFVKYIDIVTVYPDITKIFKGIDQAVSNANLPPDEPRGCLAVCDLSFAGVDRPNSERFIEVAEKNSPICIGIIGQKTQINDKYNMIKASPGVNLDRKGDNMDQQWRPPKQVLEDGADILIVGRGITTHPEDQWESLAIKYKTFLMNTS